MTRAVATWLAVVAIATAGCSQAFRFNDDAGSQDAGRDGGPDGGPCQLPDQCECEQDAECTGVRKVCAPDFKCVECLVHADCTVNGLCDAKTRRCTTACTGDGQCTVDIRKECSTEAPRHCRACDDPPSCSGAAPICAESVGYCVQCAGDSNCSGATARCDRRTGTCVACLTSTHCQAAEFCVLATGTCQLRP